MEYKLKAYATEFRNRFGYSSIDPIDFNSLLQQLDILTIFKNCEGFSGLCIKEGDSKFMLINASDSIGRQNFTIGHELYHLFYDKEFSTHRCLAGTFPKNQKNERFADIFASHLLLPDDGILRLIPENEDKKDRISLATLLKIEQTYKCSRGALLTQLLKMDLISKEFQEDNNKFVKANAKRYGYSIELYSPGEEKALLGSYGSLANKLFQEEKISEGHFTELMLAIGVDINESFANEED